MNYFLILELIGGVLKYVTILMIPSAIVSILYDAKDLFSFVIAIVISSILSLLPSFFKPKERKFRHKEGFVAVALSWLIVSLIGALPFYFSGYFGSFIDCLFEAVSGFTTTGASVLTDIESLPKGILFWRSFMQWIGGMGVLVFMLAFMPNIGASTVNLLKAESPGPSPGKLVPKIKETAKIMYIIYLVMTAVQIILLKIAGLPLFDCMVTAFSTAGTGGFSNMNLSIGAYGNVFVEIIVTVFMFLFGVNFALYFILLRKDFKSFFKDGELRFYFITVVCAITVITINILGLYGSIFEALRHASFQVSSIVTSTGYSTTDYNLWPTFSKAILVLLMLTGCSAGSTGGGIKMIRVLILFKAIGVELSRIIHPRIIRTVKVNGRKIEDENINKIFMFFFVYFAIIVISTILVSLEGKDLVSTITSVIASVGNVGPALELAGPLGNYSVFSNPSKLVFIFDMLAGRLELFPVLILFAPSIWKRGSLT